jgi:hypothetical protein
VEKLRRIEALHARPGSEGERQAAERARGRIQARLKQLEAEEQAEAAPAPAPQDHQGSLL